MRALVNAGFVAATVLALVAGVKMSVHNPAVPSRSSKWSDRPLVVSDQLAKIMPVCVTVLSTSKNKKIGTQLRKSGAGVVIYGKSDHKLQVLTVAHVAELLGAGTGFVRVHGQGVSIMAEVRVINSDTDVDLALLETTEDWVGDEGQARLASVSPKLGDTVTVVGTPNGAEFNVSKGIISGKRSCLVGSSGRCYRTDAAMYFGNSGGGVFNDQGELIGIADYVEVEEVQAATDFSSVDMVVPGSGGVIDLETVGKYLEDQGLEE